MAGGWSVPLTTGVGSEEGAVPLLGEFWNFIPGSAKFWCIFMHFWKK